MVTPDGDGPERSLEAPQPPETPPQAPEQIVRDTRAEVQGLPKRERALQRLEAGVRAIQDTESFKRFLEASRRFHDYSWANWMMILLQRPDARHVAGYKAWQAVGRQVKANERGIQIFAPMLVRRKEPAEAAGGEPEGQGEEAKKDQPLVYFRIVHVFDISQTEGLEVPDVEVPLLQGGEGEELYRRLADVARRRVTLIDDKPLNGRAAGAYFVGTNEIHVDPSYAPAQRAKTLAHELAHAIANHRGAEDKAEIETVAEAVAFLVCDHCGLDTSERSFPYIAKFSRDIDTFRRVMDAVRATSDALLDELFPRSVERESNSMTT